MTQTPRLARRALLAAAPALLLAGRAQAATALLVGDQKGGAQALMEAAGTLAGAPYAVRWTQFPAASPVLEALNAGAVDLALAGDAPVTFALAAGVQGHIIAATRVSGAGTAIMVPPGSPIRTAADLKGKTVAVNRGSIGHALVLATIADQGWQAGDIKVANLLPSDAKTALAAGAVDGWSSWGIYVAEALADSHVRVVTDGRGGRISGLSYLVATDAAIAGKRAALLDFSRRLDAARRWAETHRDAYAQALAANIGVPAAITRAMLDLELPRPVPIDAAVLRDQQGTADLYARFGLIQHAVKTAGLFDASFNEALSG